MPARPRAFPGSSPPNSLIPQSITRRGPAEKAWPYTTAAGPRTGFVCASRRNLCPSSSLPDVSGGSFARRARRCARAPEEFARTARRFAGPRIRRRARREGGRGESGLRPVHETVEAPRGTAGPPRDFVGARTGLACAPGKRPSGRADPWARPPRFFARRARSCARPWNRGLGKSRALPSHEVVGRAESRSLPAHEFVCASGKSLDE